MQDAIRVLAGDCTVRYEDRSGTAAETREQRGAVVALVKPDNTVLVHDAAGYQPAAWLTRPDAVQYAREGDGFVLDAYADDERLRVESHEAHGRTHHPASPAGPPVGTCPDCGAVLVRDGGRVVCTGCLAAHSIPRDATVADDRCVDCGLPTMRVERGVAVTVCVDRDCRPVVDAVRERLDGEWECPDCGDGLRIRERRGVRAVCEGCGTALRVPAGTVDGDCDCGLPRFDTRDGGRCLDATCGVP